MNTPLVSIIVPAYNHERYITQCINSILSQTYKNFELIVFDDGSKDNTPIILKELQDKYLFTLIIQENIGLSATLTKAISQYAKGEYISICASDDYWLEDKIKVQVDFMQKNKEYAMCFGRTYYVDLESKLIDQSVIKSEKLYGGYIFEEIITQKFHPPVNYMIRKEILAEFGYYNSGTIAEDFYMNCKISQKYPIGFIDQFLGFYRVDDLEKKRDPYKLLLDHRKTIDGYLNHPYYTKAVLYSNLRSFYLLSCYKKYKFLSLKYMLLLLPYSHKRFYWAGVYHLLYMWRKF